MNKQITSVFYSSDLLPYKDSERSVHYPLVSGTFAGSHNTKEVRFYVRDIGGTNGISWVVVSKLPNGKIGYEVCSNVQTDSELGEQYLSFDLSAYYTQLKGDLYLALRGYQGQITFEDDDNDGVYNISGDPLIEVTGTIKLSINYSPMVNTGTQVLPTEIDRIIAALSNYALLENSIIVTTDKSQLDIDDYDLDTVFFEYKLTSGVYQGRFYGIVVENNERYWEELRFSQLDTQDINIYGSTKVWGELRITNNSRIIYGDNQLKFIVNGHTFALSTSGVLTIDNNELATEDYVDNAFDELDAKKVNIFTDNFVSTVTIENLFNSIGNKWCIAQLASKWYLARMIGVASNIYSLHLIDLSNLNHIYNNSISGQTTISSFLSTATNVENATKSYVDSAIADFLQNEYSKVNTTTYPTLDDFLASTGEEGYIYLYPIDTSDESKGYYQYIWENNAWVSLGTTQIDLSDYYDKQEVDDLLDDKANASEVYTKTETNDLLDDKQDELTFDNTPTEDSSNPVTSGGVYDYIEDKFVVLTQNEYDVLTPDAGTFYFIEEE